MTSPTGRASSAHQSIHAPPPLPPRASSSNEAPPPYSLLTMSSQDPRSSSTQSLVPDSTLESAGRRRLLLVYIHGFMGNETSFRSFPAHVHNLTTVTLSESHVVHTKIYPRYRSRNALEVARDDFSRWLAPHEDQWTDIILLGHSMGGLLAADIALVFRHRIIGIINFDVPFLGMHPGIVKAGLGSIFSPPPKPQDAIVSVPDIGKRPSRIGTLFNSKPSDPNYNPSFTNDVQLPMRKGWENTLHWLSKHYNDGLRQATKGLVQSHLEFGGAMADYRELKDRYARVRALEEDDEKKRQSALPNAYSTPRIRFVNYYTTTYGRPKKPKSLKSPSPLPSRPASVRSHVRQNSSRQANQDSPHTKDDQRIDEDAEIVHVSPRLTPMSHIHPEPVVDSLRSSMEGQQYCGNEVAPICSHEQPAATDLAAVRPKGSIASSELPNIPPIPSEPAFVDLMQFDDKSQRRAAEKEHEKALKEYQKAVKARNKAINERTKMEEKWEKQNEALSREDRQRQAEAEQRQSETRQRQLEANQRRKEADERLSRTHNRPSTPSERHNTSDFTVSSTLEREIDSVQLGSAQLNLRSTQSPYANYDFSRSAIMSQTSPEDQASFTDSTYTLSTINSQSFDQGMPGSQDEASNKPKKLKKFCMLPPKDAQGNKDPTWIQVLMEGMDEVTAHTSLFFVNETYERLVGDVGARIEDWVREADSLRLVREMEGLQ